MLVFLPMPAYPWRVPVEPFTGFGTERVGAAGVMDLTVGSRGRHLAPPSTHARWLTQSPL